MAKTIIIKNANYEDNALDKVVFTGTPCTGIFLSESSYSLSSYDPVEVEYSVTPADTTDTIVWTSSDDTVITVENGVLTVNGIGTAIITVACGNFSDSATVTVTSLPYIPDWGFNYISIENNYTYIISVNYSRMGAFGYNNQATSFVIVEGSTGVPTPAIKLPANTGRVKINVSNTSALYNGNETVVMWASDESCGQPAYPQGIKKISYEDPYNGKTYPEKIFNVPTGVDSMALCIRLASQQAEGTDPNNYATETIGLSIEFLPAE